MNDSIIKKSKNDDSIVEVDYWLIHAFANHAKDSCGADNCRSSSLCVTEYCIHCLGSIAMELLTEGQSNDN